MILVHLWTEHSQQHNCFLLTAGGKLSGSIANSRQSQLSFMQQPSNQPPITALSSTAERLQQSERDFTLETWTLEVAAKESPERKCLLNKISCLLVSQRKGCLHITRANKIAVGRLQCDSCYPTDILAPNSQLLSFVVLSKRAAIKESIAMGSVTAHCTLQTPAVYYGAWWNTNRVSNGAFRKSSEREGRTCLFSLLSWLSSGTTVTLSPSDKSNERLSPEMGPRWWGPPFQLRKTKLGIILHIKEI